MIDSRRRQTVRNLVIFAIVSVSIGWVGLWLNRMMSNAAPGRNLGMLLWLVVPALTGVLLRAVGGDGWSDFGLTPALKKNLGWYAFSLLVYPACVAPILARHFRSQGVHQCAAQTALGHGRRRHVLLVAHPRDLGQHAMPCPVVVLKQGHDVVLVHITPPT
jgi:hypothetical protein